MPDESTHTRTLARQRADLEKEIEESRERQADVSDLLIRLRELRQRGEKLQSSERSPAISHEKMS